MKIQEIKQVAKANMTQIDGYAGMFRLFGPYVAELSVSNSRKWWKQYNVVKLMSDACEDLILTAYVNQGQGTMSWSVEELGGNDWCIIDIPRQNECSFEDFKKWCIATIQNNRDRFQLTEAKAPSFPKAVQNWPKQAVLLHNGYYMEFKAQGAHKITYEIRRFMDDDLKGYVRCAKTGPIALYWQMADHNDMPASTAAMTGFAEKWASFEEFKAWTKQRFQGVLRESSYKDPVDELTTDWSRQMILKGGWTLTFVAGGTNYKGYKISRLMNDSDNLGSCHIMRPPRRHADELLSISYRVHDPSGKIIAAQHWVDPIIINPFDVEQFKDWVSDKLNAGILKEAKDIWHEITIESPSGWPPQFADLWTVLDDVFDGGKNWGNVITPGNDYLHSFKEGLPLVIKYRDSAKLDYKKLRAAGYHINFLPD